jgi:hypothetical protein
MLCYCGNRDCDCCGTLRDEFAKVALAELIRKLPYIDTKTSDPPGDDKLIKAMHDAIVRSAYSYADSAIVIRSLDPGIWSLLDRHEGDSNVDSTDDEHDAGVGS